MFTKSVHQQSYRKLLARHHIMTSGKSFEETLIKLLEKQQEQIDALESRLKVKPR